MQQSQGLRAVLLLLVVVVAVLAAEENQETWLTDWPPGESWQWILTESVGGTVDRSVPAQVYDVDLWYTPAEEIASLKADGIKVICYFSAGSSESWRPDMPRFPWQVLGNNLAGWAGERWLDIRAIPVLSPIMRFRMDLAAEKGCDAVEPDNIDGFQNNSGFDLTPEDQLKYNLWLADEAHARGLAIGLKNDVQQVGSLVDAYDFAVNEQCWHYGECFVYEIFLRNNKAVYGAEYNWDEIQSTCPRAAKQGFSVIYKDLYLDALPHVDCNAWAQTAGHPCRRGWCTWSLGTCTLGEAYANGTACGGDSCNGVCMGGECDADAGTQCPDADGCIYSTCRNGQCSAIPVPDGGECIDGGTCMANECIPAPPPASNTTANASKSISLDASIDPACLVNPDGTRCGNRSACVALEQCQSGRCEIVAAPGIICDDQDACTQDACIAETEQCTFTPIACSDSNACTVDTCNSQHGCVFRWNDCDDSNRCTEDLCDPATGCYHVPLECPGDSNPCTLDVCDIERGCHYVPLCDDEDPCTTDACDATIAAAGVPGACTHTPVQCNQPGEQCDTVTGACGRPAATPRVLPAQESGSATPIALGVCVAILCAIGVCMQGQIRRPPVAKAPGGVYGA